MNRKLFISIAAFWMIAILSGCHHKELCYRHPHTARVRINTDWSHFEAKEKPTGMTVMIYRNSSTATGKSKPTGENEFVSPVKVLSNNTAYIETDLPEGVYHSVVFNQSESEFGTLLFSNMEDWQKAQVTTGPAPTKWYTTRNEDEKTAHEPEWFGTSSREGAILTYEMIQQWGQAYGLASKAPDAINLDNHDVKNVIYTIEIHVLIKNVYNLKSVRGAITGMAEGYNFSGSRTLGSKVTHLLEEWKLEIDKTDPTRGTIKKAFQSFGLPAGHSDQPEENMLNLSVLLVDNKTQLDFPFEVGHLWQENADGRDLKLTLNLELKDPLPDVKPVGGSEGGFDATVEDWGEEIEVVVPV